MNKKIIYKILLIFIFFIIVYIFLNKNICMAGYDTYYDNTCFKTAEEEQIIIEKQKEEKYSYKLGPADAEKAFDNIVGMDLGFITDLATSVEMFVVLIYQEGKNFFPLTTDKTTMDMFANNKKYITYDAWGTEESTLDPNKPFEIFVYYKDSLISPKFTVKGHIENCQLGINEGTKVNPAGAYMNIYVNPKYYEMWRLPLILVNFTDTHTNFEMLLEIPMNKPSWTNYFNTLEGGTQIHLEKNNGHELVQNMPGPSREWIEEYKFGKIEDGKIKEGLDAHAKRYFLNTNGYFMNYASVYEGAPSGFMGLYDYFDNSPGETNPEGLPTPEEMFENEFYECKIQTKFEKVESEDFLVPVYIYDAMLWDDSISYNEYIYKYRCSVPDYCTCSIF